MFFAIPFICDGQLIFSDFNDECIVWSEATTSSKNLEVVQKGDSCIVTEYVKYTAGGEWVKIITPDATGFVMLRFLNMPPGSIFQLIREKDSKKREEESKEFMDKNVTNWKLIRERTRREVERKEIELREKKKAEEQLELEKQKSQLKQLEEKLRLIKSELSKYKFLVTDYSFPPREYSGYPDFNVSVLNCSNKPIKYIWFNVTTYNPVNDVVANKTVRGIGPIKPFDFGEYTFEMIVLSKVVDYGKIISVKVQYMDGTTMSFTGKQLQDNLKKADKAIEKYRTESNY